MINQEIVSELEIIGHRGAETASGAISLFTKRTIAINLTSVSFQPIETIPEQLGTSEAMAAGMLTRISGDITGNALLVFTESNAKLLTSFFCDTSAATKDGFDEIERSMLQETANITITSFMNCLGTHLGRKCIPNAPIFLRDLAGAILSMILMENAAVSDTVLMFSTNFCCRDEDLDALLIFLPSPESLTVLREGVCNA